MSSPKQHVVIGKLEELEQDLKFAQREYLRRFGWSETCNTPGSFWLWRRDFTDVDVTRLAQYTDICNKVKADGRTNFPSRPQPFGVIAVSIDTAISMTMIVLDADAS